MLLVAPGVSSAQPVYTDYVESELVAEPTSVQPGQPFWVALRMKMDEHWHTYWRNGGDAGLGTTISWMLPEGFEAGPIQWPYPQKIELPPLASYGYEGEVFLLTEITPPASLEPGTTVDIAANADWLVCADICLPGGAGYHLALPVKSGAPTPDLRWADAFAATRDRLPLTNAGWDVQAAVNDSMVLVHATAPAWFSGTISHIEFFPYDGTLIDHAWPQKTEQTATGYLISTRRFNASAEIPAEIQGILVAEEGWRGPDSERAIAFTASPQTALSVVAVASVGEVSGIWIALVFAFIGGIILNLMPCVLPVLSIKILGFVHQAGEDHVKGWHHGAMFTAGVLLSFLSLAGALLMLQAGGEQLGWGFQLQSPAFLVILSSFLFLFGLSLFGVFEIGASLTSIGGRIDTRTGLAGSFVSGVTATVVATPCTAPFMGSALGYALTQSSAQALLIFAFLGLGMAAPYLLLSSSPALLRFVPKPGAWMESFKQFMGFLLMATVVWLVWVLGIQTGPDMVAMLLGALVLLGLGAWILGRWATPMATDRTRAIARVLAGAIIVISLGYTLSVMPAAGVRTARIAVSEAGLPWEPFSTQRVDELRQAGTPVFVDFTAAWCLSCQVNERVALNDSRVVEKFEALGIVPLKADWTSRDPEITQALAQFGRNSVPLYVLYTGAPNAQPALLPEILTPGIVLDALDAVKTRTASR